MEELYKETDSIVETIPCPNFALYLLLAKRQEELENRIKTYMDNIEIARATGRTGEDVENWQKSAAYYKLVLRGIADVTSDLELELF